jgi:hypothetical protein
MTTTTAHELDHRAADGIHVRLLWYPDENRVTVEVRDESTDETFELDVPPDRARDAFLHPFAYAAFAGAAYGTAPREPIRA